MGGVESGAGFRVPPRPPWPDPGFRSRCRAFFPRQRLRLFSVGAEGAGGRDRGRRGGGTRGAEAATQEQLLVLAIKVEDLQVTLTRLLEDLASALGRIGGAGAQLGQAGLEARGEGAFAFAPGLVGRTPFVLEDAVLLHAEAMELVAKREVAGQQFGETHVLSGAGLSEAAPTSGDKRRISPSVRPAHSS